jgi:hypothetical protein
MRENTNFWAGFFGPDGVRGNHPIGPCKYLDWKRADELCRAFPNSIVQAGLREDWDLTCGTIFAENGYYKTEPFTQSVWATPILVIDDQEFECWTHERSKDTDYTALGGTPEWWGLNGT